MRYFIEFSYDGTNYFGYQKQPNQITVQEVLEDRLSKILRTEIKTVGAGRTDTGVHASKMFAHFDYADDLTEKFIDKMNSFLPQDILIKKFIKVAENAHARFDAVKRTYKYSITTTKNPFKREFHAQYLNYNLDLIKMNNAAKILFKYLDFTSFSKLHADNKTNDCVVKQAKWEEKNDEFIFTISANRFLRNMVRAIVGTLIDVGRGKISEQEFELIIQKKNRSFASTSAPAKGLILIDIEYPPEIFK
ncbi:tRNA pseudouridine(38-40) synthase TruA [Apibacter muscae]|uniref:tRNA pseudouridine synthase A n=1 Tax=Apibacter muscae TaxID=2509004 RepID=A0A563DGC6_9FLAO|nr:tRNA pseudouridine(38-40) synthase TruA [Apibacter muscae]TWP29298.1 tRNA pseudouridine(38-40) synthase TruA [Apibacter muscae]TWP31112.1 tRNA pseudouridine(38-40) synthase TruA [Apibacter muscae]